MKMTDRRLNLATLLPSSYEYPFVDEPGVLKIYAQYRNTADRHGRGSWKSASIRTPRSTRWKAALSDLRIVVDLGSVRGDHVGRRQLQRVERDLDRSIDKPHLQFGSVLDPVGENPPDPRDAVWATTSIAAWTSA